MDDYPAQTSKINDGSLRLSHSNNNNNSNSTKKHIPKYELVIPYNETTKSALEGKFMDKISFNLTFNDLFY